MSPPSATAATHAVHDGVVGETPVSYTPDVLDGHVSAFLQVGNVMIAGGRFTRVEQDGKVFERRNLFAFDATTGRVLRYFHPQVYGEVFDLELAPNGVSVVAVGGFSSIDRHRFTSRVARVRVSTGAVDPGFRSPLPNDTVRDVTYANGVYYVAGEFTKLGDHARRVVAVLDRRGADTGIAHLNFQGNNSGGQTKAESMDVSADGTTMVVIGNFSEVEGQARGQVAVVDLTPTTATLSPWRTDAYQPSCGPRFDTYMRQVAIDPTGAYFVIAATGGPLGRQPNGLLCDTAARWELDGATDHEPTWINYTGGDTLTAVIVDSQAVYIGGHMRWVNNSYGRNDPRAGAVPREGVAALDPANGLPYTWNPGRRRGYGVYQFALTDDGLWTGSDTTGFGSRLRSRIAMCRIATGAKLPDYQTGTLPGTLVRLGAGASTDVATVGFNGSTATTPPAAVSSNENWQDVRGAFVVDGVLYSGWSDGVFRAQSFDGSTLGSSGVVDVHGAFPDLTEVRTMFFDRVSRRIYYTLNGSDQLYYRYFQPQSRTVGSWRYEVDSPGNVDWSAVDGAFIVKAKLFLANGGSLSKIDWDTTAGTTVGMAEAIPDAGDVAAAALVFTG